MIDAKTTKLEIDVMQAVDLQEASTLAAVHKMPAIVVHHEILREAYVMRAKMQALYSIIAPIDWPRGEQYGSDKIRGVTPAMLDCDGYEIMLTAKQYPNEIANEVKLVSDFILRHFRKGVEVRFVLGTNSRTPETVAHMCSALKFIPAPALIRTDIQLKAQQSKCGVEAHNAALDAITALTGVPVKICGNVTLDTMERCYKASRFSVSLKQANDIVKELAQRIKDAVPKPPAPTCDVIVTQ